MKEAQHKVQNTCPVRPKYGSENTGRIMIDPDVGELEEDSQGHIDV